MEIKAIDLKKRQIRSLTIYRNFSVLATTPMVLIGIEQLRNWVKRPDLTESFCLIASFYMCTKGIEETRKNHHTLKLVKGDTKQNLWKD